MQISLNDQDINLSYVAVEQIFKPLERRVLSPHSLGMSIFRELARMKALENSKFK
jgi:hypothetical protein